MVVIRVVAAEFGPSRGGDDSGLSRVEAGLHGFQQAGIALLLGGQLLLSVQTQQDAIQVAAVQSVDEVSGYIGHGF